MGQTCCSSHLFAMLLGACRRCGALILRGRTGEASDRTRSAGEPIGATRWPLRRDARRRKPDVACSEGTPFLSLGDIGHRTSDGSTELAEVFGPSPVNRERLG